MRVALLAVLAVSSVAHADPATLARSLVMDQLAAAPSPRALLATLSPNAVILGNGSFAVASGANAPGVVSTLLRGPLTQSVLNSLDAGGSGDAIWLSADVTFIDASGCGGTDARLVELAVAERNHWSVVALSFVTNSDLVAPSDVLDRPRSGPLTGYLASFAKIQDALRDDGSTMVAFGGKARTDGFALGRDDARRVLGPLREQDVTTTHAIEVHGSHWGYAFGSLAIAGEPRRSAQVLLIAILDGQTWRVVAVHAVEPAADAATRPGCVNRPITTTSLQSKTVTP